MVITENRFTRQGLRGIDDLVLHDSFRGYFEQEESYVVGGRYRPLSLVTFSLEHAVLGGNPHVSHAVNALLYALTGVLIAGLLARLLPRGEAERWLLSVPFVTALLFVAHPVHTEVVANIKGRDEILALLFALATLGLVLRFVERRDGRFLIAAGAAFLAALLAKESAITFLLVIPLALHFFVPGARGRFGPVLSALGVPSVVFLLLRGAVLVTPPAGAVDELLNDPFLEMSLSERTATIFRTLGAYLRLLVFPHPLTYDYYPYHVPITSWSDPRALGSLAVHAGLLGYAAACFARKTVPAFGILSYAITLSIVSNLVFPVGVFMAERFLYAPSLGFCLVVAHGLLRGAPVRLRAARVLAGAMAALLLAALAAGSWLTVRRNAVWRDNFTLTTTDVLVSAESAQANAAAGDFLIVRARETQDRAERGRLYARALTHLERAVAIHPRYEKALAILADAYYEETRDYDRAIDSYERVLAINPGRRNLQYNLGTLYLQHRNDTGRAIRFLSEAVRQDPTRYDAWKNLGGAYFYAGELARAAETYEKAAERNPGDVSLLENLALVYERLGNPEKVRYYRELARTVARP